MHFVRSSLANNRFLVELVLLFSCVATTKCEGTQYFPLTNPQLRKISSGNPTSHYRVLQGFHQDCFVFTLIDHDMSDGGLNETSLDVYFITLFSD